MTDLPQEKKPKRNLTDKKGRQKRMEMIKQKQESKQQEYDLSSDESYTSSSDNDAFVISKAKKKPIKQRVQKESKPNLKRNHICEKM